MNPPKTEMSPPTQEERDAVSSCLSVLPPELRTPTVASVLLMALRSDDARQRLWADPRQALKNYGVKLSANTRIVAHDPQKDGIVLVLPRLGAMAPTTVGAAPGAKVELADSDLRSGSSRTVEFAPLSKDWDWVSPNDNDKSSPGDSKAADAIDEKKDTMPDKDRSTTGDKSFD